MNGPAIYSEKIQKTAAYYGSLCIRVAREMRWPLVNRDGLSRPVIVVGCSRSGTTVTYKTLSLAEELATLNRESHEFWSRLHPPEENGWDGHDLAAKNVSEADRNAALRYYYTYCGPHRFVDKANQNGFRIPYLDALFKEAIFVFVKRSPGDNVSSLITGWGRPEEYGDWSAGLPSKLAIDDGRYTRWCFFLFSGWREYVNASIEEVCAAQWCEYNRAVLQAKPRVSAGRWVDLVYEELLDDPVACFRSLFEQLGLRFTTRMHAHCEGLVSRPYNAFSTPARDKWRTGPHREQVARILPRVVETARELGYSVAT